jgi:hypothetical protein
MLGSVTVSAAATGSAGPDPGSAFSKAARAFGLVVNNPSAEPIFADITLSWSYNISTSIGDPARDSAEAGIAIQALDPFGNPFFTVSLESLGASNSGTQSERFTIQPGFTGIPAVGVGAGGGASVVPEPSGFALMVLALLGLLGRRGLSWCKRVE